MLQPIILAGGSGSRLWPLSRHLNPKQFLALTGPNTMLQETVQRLDGMETAAPIVICNDEHRFLAAEQLRAIGIDKASILLEPVARNTAPAIALGAMRAMADGDDPLLLVLAADHAIADREAFQAGLRTAIPVAEAGRLVTFGIVPDRPETGYGYIQAGDALPEGGFSVSRFVEKPDLATAEGYLASGDFSWNSGMFLFRASVFLSELRRFEPAMVDACRRALDAARADLDFLRIDRIAFEKSPSQSIDYAVMEKTDLAAVVPLDAGWNDIGSWSALWDLKPKDADGNVFDGDVLSSGVSDTLVRADHRLVAVVGTRDLVIIETKDALLVAHKDKVQDVKDIVAGIKAQGRHEHFNHREIYRPWGYFDRVDHGGRDVVNRLVVKPGGRVSTQMHHHRAEHWIVVKGTARVTIGDKTVVLSENQSTYIPIGDVHTLENPGLIPLEIIEVQTGSYLGADDIVRFDANGKPNARD